MKEKTEHKPKLDKSKLFTRIMAGALAGLMLLGILAGFIIPLIGR